MAQGGLVWGMSSNCCGIGQGMYSHPCPQEHPHLTCPRSWSLFLVPRNHYSKRGLCPPFNNWTSCYLRVTHLCLNTTGTGQKHRARIVNVRTCVRSGSYPSLARAILNSFHTNPVSDDHHSASPHNVHRNHGLMTITPLLIITCHSTTSYLLFCTDHDADNAAELLLALKGGHGVAWRGGRGGRGRGGRGGR
jgi:hypothetical protein